MENFFIIIYRFTKDVSVPKFGQKEIKDKYENSYFR